MDEVNKRISSLSPAKRALLELRLKQSGAQLTAADAISPRIDPVQLGPRFLKSDFGFSSSLI